MKRKITPLVDSSLRRCTRSAAKRDGFKPILHQLPLSEPRKKKPRAKSLLNDIPVVDSVPTDPAPSSSPVRGEASSGLFRHLLPFGPFRLLVKIWGFRRRSSLLLCLWQTELMMFRKCSMISSLLSSWVWQACKFASYLRAILFASSTCHVSYKRCCKHLNFCFCCLLNWYLCALLCGGTFGSLISVFNGLSFQ